jgi:hypothetical protein
LLRARCEQASSPHFVRRHGYRADELVQIVQNMG